MWSQWEGKAMNNGSRPDRFNSAFTGFKWDETCTCGDRVADPPPAGCAIGAIHHCINRGGRLWKVERWMHMAKCLHYNQMRCNSGQLRHQLSEVRIEAGSRFSKAKLISPTRAKLTTWRELIRKAICSVNDQSAVSTWMWTAITTAPGS